jgi:UDP-GlcNAc:undecaprenyl-phosphate GlcNAc-1-phosphate transferase
MKGQTLLAILIPVIALGVPILDTLLAPVRRWLRGKKMFSPDKSHIHHHLLRLGFDHRDAVLLLYGVSVVLGVFALILVNIKDSRAAIILAFLWVVIFIGIRKLGYMEYLAIDKFYGWLKDLTDVAGLSQTRRTFLGMQVDMDEARSVEELWEKMMITLDCLKFDRAEFHIIGPASDVVGPVAGEKAGSVEHRLNRGRNKECKESFQSVIPTADGVERVWTRGYYRRAGDTAHDGFLKIEVPLMNDKEDRLGSLRLMKDIRREPLEYFTLRRVEHLRRTITGVLNRLGK